jgi:hypothetical protein
VDHLGIGDFKLPGTVGLAADFIFGRIVLVQKKCNAWSAGSHVCAVTIVQLIANEDLPLKSGICT